MRSSSFTTLTLFGTAIILKKRSSSKQLVSMGKLTYEQSLALAIVRSVFSIPSLIGSAYIMQHVLRSAKRREQGFTRIMLGMASMDFLFSMYAFSNRMPAPESTGQPLALGNVTTCTVFGFLGQGSRCASVLYNASLTLYYLLTIRYSWTEGQWKKYVELWAHLVPLVIGWGTAIAGIPLTLYNPAGATCSIQGYPRLCDSNSGVKCIRGEHAKIYQVAFFHVWVWLVFGFMIVAMTMIYQSIARVERASEGYRFESGAFGAQTSTRRVSIPMSSSSQYQQRPRRRLFATQAWFYCLAFFATWSFNTLQLIVRDYIKGTNQIPLAFLLHIFSVLQGFWNALIYVWPRYSNYRRQQERQRQLQQTQGQKSSRGPTSNSSHQAQSHKDTSVNLDELDNVSNNLEDGEEGQSVGIVILTDEPSDSHILDT